MEAAELHGKMQIGPYVADMPAAYMLADVVVSTGGARQGFSRALVEAQAIQCGFCTPGIAIAAAALLARNADPSADDIKAAVPNLCRCGVSPRPVEAIPRAGRITRGAQAIAARPPVPGPRWPRLTDAVRRQPPSPVADGGMPTAVPPLPPPPQTPSSFASTQTWKATL